MQSQAKVITIERRKELGATRVGSPEAASLTNYISVCTHVKHLENPNLLK